MRLRYSRRALAQVDEIVAYIAKEDPRAAAAFGARVDGLALLLTRYPSIGRPTNLDEIRTISLRPYPYRLFYKVLKDADEVRILRVRHTRRAG